MFFSQTLKQLRNISILPQMFQYNQCMQEFTAQKHLMRHIQTVHKTGATYKCEICDYHTTRKDALTRHIKEVHGNAVGHKCQTCEKSFTRIADLRRHMKIHTTKRKGDISEDTPTKRTRFDETVTEADHRNVELNMDTANTND